MTLGAAGYTSMIYTEGADCALQIGKKAQRNVTNKALQTTTQLIALGLFAANGVMQGINQDWNKVGETAIQMFNAGLKLILGLIK